MTTILNIEGMMCKHCKEHVYKALMGISGVTEVNVILEDKKATVTADREITKDEFAAEIEKAGYRVV